MTCSSVRSNRMPCLRLATFHTHTGALKFERVLQSQGIPCCMKPVPRRLSSSCGVCVEFQGILPDPAALEDVGKIYRVEGKDYHLEYSDALE